MTNEVVREVADKAYQYGFTSPFEEDRVPPGLNEDVIRVISAKKKEPQWLTEWRLKAYRGWLKMQEPHWANFEYAPIDYQAITYYSAPKSASVPKSLDQVDPELLAEPGIYPSDETKANMFFIESLGEADLLYEEAWTSLGVGQ